MFIASELLRRTGDLNLSHNFRNNFELVGYTHRNDSYHQRDNNFDTARTQLVASRYLVPEKMLPRETQRLFRAFASVNKSLSRLQDHTDAPVLGFGQSRTSKLGITSRSQAGASLSPAHCSSCSSRGFGKTCAHTVRAYSPKNDSYVEQCAAEANRTQKAIYSSLRSSGHMQSVNVLGPGCSAEKPFARLPPAPKKYTVNSETYTTSWTDPADAKQQTSGYESARFDVISHGMGKRTKELRRLYETDPKACNRVKSIAQYSDITRVNAPRFGAEYQAVVKGTPKCFNKSGTTCARLCDAARSNGPFYKLFK